MQQMSLRCMIRHSLSDRMITFEKILDKNMEKLEATIYKNPIREKVSTALLKILFGNSILVYQFSDINKCH